jgi:tetratricopeptide (TPR) repeat protein
MDSMSVRNSGPQCVACEALTIMFGAYQFMDSVDATERLAREWVARQPSSPMAWYLLREALSWRDSTGALAAYERMRITSPASPDDMDWLASLSIRSGNFRKAERLLVQTLESGSTNKHASALWWLAISQRHQGRLNDALATTVRMRRLDPTGFPSLLEGQVLFEMGRYREATAVFDRWVRHTKAFVEPAYRARNVTWMLTHRSAAMAAAGDTERLESIADSMEVIGLRSGYGRDRLLHHHVRGLILAARGRQEDAVAEFRRAIWSPVAGYTRTNFELGRLLIELGRPQEAIPLLRAALHGGLESTNLYVTHTEIRALLSRAYASTNQPDSAAVEARWVERALANADPIGRARIDRLLGRPLLTTRRARDARDPARQE